MKRVFGSPCAIPRPDARWAKKAEGYTKKAGRWRARIRAIALLEALQRTMNVAADGQRNPRLVAKTDQSIQIQALYPATLPA
ncbi:hypothetical protein [Thauera sp. Sel9]|uniref:hypothetical protein n=1 Tax=Thauera sp. Sel9 TaxID=2974299 RepID=UPI0021E149D1|nr:hypothetical protein [Thauera sp. Sel9]